MDSLALRGSRNRYPHLTEDAFVAGLRVMGWAPEGGSRMVTHTLSRLARTPTERMVSAWLEGWFGREGPGGSFARRVSELHPRVRRHLLARMFTNFVGDPKWFDEFERTYGFTPPYVLALSPSMRCNLRCAGCYAGNYERADDLSEEVVDRVITEAEELGIFIFVVIGGEPFMWPPLLDVIERHPHSIFQVYTNGLLIDDDIAARLVRLGNVVPAVSIEGGQQATDERRGRGVYQRVLQTMDRLREHRLLFAFSATATSHNLDDIVSDEFIDLMVEKGALYGWYFSYAPVGLDPDLALMPTPRQRQRLRQEVGRIRREKPILTADFWNDGPLTGGCIAAGKIYLHINNHGDVEPCVFCHFAVDNIKERSLLDALRSPFFQDLRKAQPFGHNLLRPCPLIDHPGVMRRMVERHEARPTHPGAESLITTLQPGLHDYAAELRDVTTPIWAEDFQWVETWLGGDRRWQRRRATGRDAEEDEAEVGSAQARG